MKFSDMMGSGGDRPPKRKDETDSETAIANAIAPYLDSRSEPVPAPEPVPLVEPIESATPVAPPTRPAPPVVPVVPVPEPFTTPTGPYAPPLEPAAATRPVAPPAPPQPQPQRHRSWQPDRPVAPEVTTASTPAANVSTSASATATALADFTPLSDDLLPRRR